MSSDTPPPVDIKPDVDMSGVAVSPLLGKRKRSADDVGSDNDSGGGSDSNSDDGSDSDSDDSDSFIMPDDDFVAPEDNSDEDDDESDGPNEDESDSEVGENDMPQDPYYETAEPYPGLPIYDPSITKITKRLLGIPQQVIHILSSYNGNGKNVNDQLEAAKKLTTVPKPPKVRIGLLGDAGAGKSSLLNSMTDINDLAKSLSGGQSCTCVPTEYSSAFPNQRKSYAASIRYFDIAKIKQVLEVMLGDYNLFAFESDKDWDDDQRTQFKRAMQNALKTFRVLFCDLKEFKDDQVAKDFLKSNWEDESVDAISMFLESCEKKLKDKITFKHGYAEFVEAGTRIKLRELVDPLMGAKAKGDKPALWPLVRHVVYAFLLFPWPSFANVYFAGLVFVAQEFWRTLPL